MKVGMDEQTGKMRIEAWCESRNGKFNSSELQEIYLNASTECEELNDDPAAVNLLEAFGSHENGLSYQVFSWERGLPEGIEPIEPGEPDIFEPREHVVVDGELRCACCQTADFVWPPPKPPRERKRGHVGLGRKRPRKQDIYATWKYKPVALKAKPVYTGLPEQFHIKRDIRGNPLGDIPRLFERPEEFRPTGRYTKERKEIIDKLHKGDFLWGEERKLMHHFMMIQNEAFAWDDSEHGSFKHEFFLPIEIPVMEHKPWDRTRDPNSSRTA